MAVDTLEQVAFENLTTEQKVDILVRRDPTAWVRKMGIVLANGETFSFEQRPYLIKPMRSKHRQICVMKAAGMGFSETFVLRGLHGCIFGILIQGLLYLFPNADEMRKFSQSRFNTLIQANKSTIGKYVKSGGKGGTDSANLKRVGNSNLFLDGATLTQNVGESIQQKESAALRGKHVDEIDFDELDLMDKDIITQAKPRLSNSDIRRMAAIANPTIPNFGIDKLFQQSDQEWWFRKCLHCNHWNCPDLVFPDYIGIDDTGIGYCACQKCGKPLGLGIYEPKSKDHSCEWVAQKPDNKEWEGYHISTLNHPKQDPYETLKNFKKAQEPGGNLSHFYKFELGLPYIDSADQLTTPAIYDCCGQDVISIGNQGPCAMGLDIGLVKHAVIGFRADREKWEVIKPARIQSFDDALILIPRFGIKSAVVDIRPYEDDARKFQEKALAMGCRVYLCEYTTNPMEEAFWDNNRKVVKAYRTGLLDLTHRLVTNKQIKIPRRCPEIDEFAKQMCATAKVPEEGKFGATVFNYIKLGDDHYRHALGYFYLAASGSRIASVNKSSSNQQEYAIHQTVKI